MSKLYLLPLIALIPLRAQPQPADTQVHHLEERPVFRVDVVAKVTVAVNYRHRSGATAIAFRGTPLMPLARGGAKVESKRGYIEIEVEFKNLQPAIRYGAEYLTYVMWAITPEGRTANLGEILIKDGRSKLNVTTELQVFGMVVTAEPYFAVRQPSDLVVMENELREETKGKIEVIDAKYELLKRGQYEPLANPLALTVDPQVPLELYEARNAIQIARSSGAAEYAADTFLKAERSLRQAEAYQARDAGKKPVAMLAREAVQVAEDSREIAVRRIEQERIAKERQEAAEREALAKKAEQEALLLAQAEAEKKAEAERRAREEIEKRAEAERLARAKAEREAEERKRLERELAAAHEATRKAEAEAARAMALLKEQMARFADERARWDAERAQRAERQTQEDERAQRQAERRMAELRATLIAQLQEIFDTRETGGGLALTIPGDLFEPEGAALRELAREKLARLAGIMAAHPGLSFYAGRDFDGPGSDALAGSLRDERGGAVRDFLLEQGLVEAPAVPGSLSDGAPDLDGVELIIVGELIAGASETGVRRP